MKYFLLFILSPIFLTNAQTDSIFVSDLSSALKVSADFYTSPLRFETEDWIKFSTVIGLTGIATLADKDIKKFFTKESKQFF